MFSVLRHYYHRHQLSSALALLLQAERRQAQQKMKQQWHWGDTGRRELAVIDAVAGWLLPLPPLNDFIAWFNAIRESFQQQQVALRCSDPDGYALATSKMLEQATLAVLSQFGKKQPGFTEALGYQLLQAIVDNDRPAITWLISAGADVRVTNEAGHDAIALATQSNSLYALVALQGETAFYSASVTCWAIALRQGVYRFKQLPAERISDELCDAALLGDRHNYYSLPAEYVSLPALARRCSVMPELIAQLPAEITLNPVFYQQVRYQTPCD